MRALLTVSLALLLAAPAGAAEPIMPLSDVQSGMRCTGLSVVRGTDIASFDVEIVDVVAGDEASAAPRIIVRVSGEAVDRTGLGPGFSGSPIVCRDREGRDAYAGAISESVGEYGGKMALATPMEQIVAQPVDPPVGTPPAPRGARTLAAPLTLAGVSPRVGRAFSQLAARQGQVLLDVSGRPRAAAFPVQQLRPGAAMAAGLSSGAVNLGAIGTVSYVDGDRLWAFGHPLNAAGRRSLFLQDAYVYTVVNNPLGVDVLSSYKLAAPGHDVGVISGDGLSAVAGRLGVLPDRFPMRVIANDGDTGRVRTLRAHIADENAIGQPMGLSPLAIVGGALVGEGATTTLGEVPARQSGEMCAWFRLAGETKSLKFCNRYVVRSGIDEGPSLGAGGPMASDLAEAVALIDGYEFGTLDMESVDVNLTLRRGLRQAYMLRARAPRSVRRGRTVPVRVLIQVVRGERAWRRLRVKVPRGLPPGPRRLTLRGPDTDSGDVFELALSELLFELGGEEDVTGPRSVEQLRKAVASISRYDGVTASFEPPDDEDEEGDEGRPRRARKVYRDSELRLSGLVRAPVFVR
ncbi:MAG TPA: hypothetical protein VGW75_18620 [Solirubrobacteraceae bacterium]|nr:hypothetical protein [Solirubrobacteraceae bacterium]